ncbi:alpha-1-acid glycoprotein 1-like [Heliangelus exortis]|uniref:alpha-1-acid glycoprotein 1-like n=1 Tax=Heliangelus exortis TaxID=472823 RepID=UPI003A9516AA
MTNSQSRRLLLAGQVMLATLILLLGLPFALTAEAPNCTQPVPVTFGNATIPRILGHWNFIASASRHPHYLEMTKAMKHASFSYFPGSHEEELDATTIVRVNETCVVKNTTGIQLFLHNFTMVHVDNQPASMAEVMQSDKDLLILKHFHDDFMGLSLSARTLNVSKEHLEEFKSYVHCLGFTEEEIFFTSEKDACPLPWDKTEGGDEEPKPE